MSDCASYASPVKLSHVYLIFLTETNVPIGGNHRLQDLEELVAGTAYNFRGWLGHFFPEKNCFLFQPFEDYNSEL